MKKSLLSKKLAADILKAAPACVKNVYFFTNISEEWYARYIDLFEYKYNVYDSFISKKDGKKRYRVIVIEYDDECYALDNYLTSIKIQDEFYSRYKMNEYPKNYNEYIEMIVKMIEI